MAVTHEFPGANDFCDDVTFDAAGNLFVTESATGQIFTVDAANVLTPNSLELFVATPGIAATETIVNITEGDVANTLLSGCRPARSNA